MEAGEVKYQRYWLQTGSLKINIGNHSIRIMTGEHAAGHTGRQIAFDILYPRLESGRWYSASECLKIIERSGELKRGPGNCSECGGSCKGDFREIGSGDLQWQRRTHNALRDGNRNWNLWDKRGSASKKFYKKRD